MSSTNRKSFYAYLACAVLLILASQFYYPKWQFSHNEATISWDVSGYYFYLPAIFIYQDLKKVEFKEDIHQQYRPASGPYQTFTHEGGNEVMKYSMGLALQYSPFFLIAHALAEPLGYPADGFSRPYQLAISLGSLFMALLGLWLLRRVLLRYFSDGVTAVTLLTIAFATNYLNYSTIDGAMTHNWLFTIYTLLIWQTIRFYDSPSKRKGLTIGLLVGIATLTRPTEIIACLIPVLWGIGNWQDARNRLRFFTNKEGFIPLLFAGIATAAVGSLQLIYWKYVSGGWIVYSYQEQGFTWLNPHVMDAMFSYRAGWLIYTPAMAFALLGFVVMAYRKFLVKTKQTGTSNYHKSKLISPLGETKRGETTPGSAAQRWGPLFYPTLLFSLLFMYITFAWDIWWYGGSLGQRAMVQAYPVLAIPLAAFFSLAEGRNWLKAVLLPILLFFTVYNFWLTHQAHKGGLFISEQMTGPYLKAVFLKSAVPEETKKLLDTDELFRGEPQQMKALLKENFESDTSAYRCAIAPIEGEKSFCLNQEVQFNPLLKAPAQPIANGWVRFAATFRCQAKEWEMWRMAQLQGKFFQDGQVVKERILRIYRLLPENGTKRIYLDIKMPEQPFDEVGLQFWNASSNKALAIDEVEIIRFTEQETH